MQSRQDIEAELELVQAARNGDDHAIAMIYIAYHDILCTDIRRYVSSDDAEDIVQDVFTTLCINRERWHIHNTLRQYLFAAVRNRARDLVARQRTEAQLQSHSPADVHRLGKSVAESADHPVLLTELETLINVGLARLTPRCQAALRGISTAGSYDALGELLGVGVPTVHTFLWRGRREMRAFLTAAGWTELPKPQTYHGPRKAP